MAAANARFREMLSRVWENMPMQVLLVFLAYAMFILILAIPFLVVAGIAAAFVAGLVMLVGGVAAGRPMGMIAGLLLVAGSGAMALTIRHCALTPPAAGAAGGAHVLVYKTYQGMRARHMAMKWLRDGTFQRLAEEEKARKAREAAANSAEAVENGQAAGEGE
jgi:hypothetical protein